MTAHLALFAVLAGVLFQASLIVAIGAQNTFVLRQGLLGEHRALVVATCALSDVALIVAGVAGAGAVLAGRPGLATAMRLAGAAFLLAYGVMAARRALRPVGLEPDVAESSGTRTTAPAVLATALAFTWLNPHVYLDVLLLVGSAADARGDARWWFGGGCAVVSVVWFCALGYGAALLRPWFARPTAWRVLDSLVAVLMLGLAVSLTVSAVG